LKKYSLLVGLVFSIFAIALLGSATLAYAGSFDFVLSFPGTGTGGGGVAFNFANEIATDSNNRIIVGDGNIPSDDVQIYDSTGAFVFAIDGSAFTSPSGVAVNSTDHIFVSDFALNKVQIYSSTGTFVAFFDGTNGTGTLFAGASAIAIDSNDRIIVGDGSADTIQIFDSNGSFLSTFTGTGTGGGGTAFLTLTDIATDSNNRIIVLDDDSSTVQIYDSAGNFVLTFDGTNGGGIQFTNESNQGIAVDSSDRIYVPDRPSATVQIFDSTGSFLSSFAGTSGGGTAFIGSSAIAIDSNDRIIVGDDQLGGAGAGLIQIYEGPPEIGTIVESLDFDGTLGATPDIVQVSGDTFAIVYVGPNNDGFIKTIRVDSSGDILTNSVIDSETFSTGTVTDPKIIHVTDLKYLLVYGDGNNIHAAIYAITSGGGIFPATVSGTSIISTGSDPDVVKLSGAAGEGNTQFYAIAYTGSGAGLVDTISVFPDETDVLSTLPSAALSFAGNSADPEIIKVSGTTYAVAFRDNTNIGHVNTLTIPDDGDLDKAIVISDTFDLNGNDPISSSSNLDIVHVTGDVYAVVHSNGAVGATETITINAAGTSLASVDVENFTPDSINVIDPVLIQTDDGTSPFSFLVAYHDATNLDGVLKAFIITDAGVISSVFDTFNFNGANGQEPVVAHRTGEFYVVAYEGTSAKGTVSSFNLGDADTTPPSVTSVAIGTTGNLGFAKSGDTVTITVVDNEELNVTAITIGGQLGTVGVNNADTVTAFRVMTGAELEENPLTFSITVADIAGNGVTLTSITTGSNLESDFTAPTAAITYSTAEPYKSGDSVTITATFSEPVAESTDPQISISGANTLAATSMGQQSPTVYQLLYTVVAGDGTATVAMVNGEDAAGNVVTSAPTSGATFTVDNTAPSFVDAFVSGTKSMVVNYNEDVVTIHEDYTLITVGAQASESSPSISGSGTPTILVKWTTATSASSGADSGITFSISGTVTDIAGNSLSNAGAQSISATADASTITTVTLDDNDGDSEVEISLTDDTFIEIIIAPAGTEIDVEISSFTGLAGDADVIAAGGTSAVFPASTITVQSDDATIIFPPSVEVGGFGATEIIEISVSVKDPSLDAEFVAAFPDLNLANVDVIEFGDPSVDLVFSSPVSITIPGLKGTIFSIDRIGNTLEISACDETVISSSTAETFIAAITGTDVLDGEACFVGTTIWTNHFSGFGGSGGGGGGGSGDKNPPSTNVGFDSTEFPLRYDNVNYQPYQFDTIHTAQIKTGEELKATLTVYEDSGAGNVQHVELYVNQFGSQILNDLTETIVIYDEQSGLEIIDPHNLIATANVIPSISGNKAVFDFVVVFKDEIPQSDVLFRIWDIKRNSIQFLLPDALIVTISEQQSNIISIVPESEISDTEPESESTVPEEAPGISEPTPGISEPTPGISEPTPGISEPTPEVGLPTKTWTSGQLSVLKQWGGYDVETASDIDVLSKFGIKGEKIPPYVKQLVKWILKDEVSQEEFVNALQYLKREGILSVSVGKQSFDVNTTPDLEEFTLEKKSIDETIKFEFDDNENSFYTQANLGDLEDKVRILRSLANNVEIQNELASSNMEFQSLTNPDALINQREAEWLQNPRTVTPFMQSLMDNEAALIAKAVIEHDKENLVPLISIIITNAYGVNTAITEKTHDYVQSDEQWWDNTKEGGTYIMSGSGGEKYTGLYTSEISLAINDSQGNFIGIIKAVVNFEKALLLD